MSNHRSRLACLPCTRRKVKCSKTVPCMNCVRRGQEDACSQDAASPGAPKTGSRVARDATASPEADQHDVDVLRARIAELEAKLSEPRAASALGRPPSRTRIDPSYPARGLLASASDPSPNEQEPDDRETALEQPEAPDAMIKDAASILEFLAWGKRKNPGFHSIASPEVVVKDPSAPGDVGDTHPPGQFPDNLNDPSTLAFLQLLLPNRRQVWHLVDYHDKCLLWYHGSYYSPTFRKQLEDFYSRFRGSIEHTGVNLQWVALLFSVLAGSITCAPEHRVQEYGFHEPERQTLSRRWVRAVITCLNEADYAANQSILSVQAIATLTISAHLLGFSNMQSIHLAAAVRIAQSLGLHRLTDDSPGGVVERETGKRVWSQLSCQDWFSLPFSETYLVNPIHSQSDPPINCNDLDLLPLSDHIPTITSYCRFLTRIASIMPRLQDGLMSCNTPFTRYEQVLFWDSRLRSLATEERPSFLGIMTLDPSWPPYIPWARRSLAISSSHKIIMIHRSFLSESFTNPAFAFTRRTCLAASKTIIKEYRSVVEEDGPILWIHQAFAVAASIILLLDVLHREPADQEYAEHKQLAANTVEILKRCNNSMIASRGVRLLSALLKEIPRPSDLIPGTLKRRIDEVDTLSHAGGRSHKRRQMFDVPTFVKSFCGHASQSSGPRTSSALHTSHNSSPAQEATYQQVNIDDSHPSMMGPGDGLQDTAYNPFVSTLGLEGSTGFEDLLYLANHDFSI